LTLTVIFSLVTRAVVGL